MMHSLDCFAWLSMVDLIVIIHIFCFLIVYNMLRVILLFMVIIVVFDVYFV